MGSVEIHQRHCHVVEIPVCNNTAFSFRKLLTHRRNNSKDVTAPLCQVLRIAIDYCAKDILLVTYSFVLEKSEPCQLVYSRDVNVMTLINELYKRANILVGSLVSMEVQTGTNRDGCIGGKID